MFGTTITRGLTFGKIITGLSKTLQMANQIIPLYQKTKPMIKNARTAFGLIKEFTKNDNTTKTNNFSNKNQNFDIENKIIKKESDEMPTFFL